MIDATKLSSRKTSLPTRRRMILGIFMLAASHFAAADNALHGIIDKYSSDFMGDAIARHTVFASSENSIEEIPAPYLYRATFLRLILNAEDTRRYFSDSDWNTIMDLPDHNDPQFQTRSMATLQSSCAQIQNIRQSGNVQAARNKAVLASEAERSQLIDFEHHYFTVMNSLSDAGRERVETELAELPEVSNMSWTSIDLIGLSEEIPQYVEFVVSQSCEHIIAAPLLSPDRRFLRDSPNHWTLMEAE